MRTDFRMDFRDGSRTMPPVETASQTGRPMRAGFTLIELMIVVAIIAILISILLPALGAARDQAKAVKCLANLKRIGFAGIMYVNDNGVYPPMRLKEVRGQTYVNVYGRTKPRWQWFFDHGIGPVINPTPYGGMPFGDSQTTTLTNNYFSCPSLTGEFARDIRNGAYGYNHQYLGDSRTENGRFPNFPVRESRITHAAATVLVADSRGGALGHGKHSYSLDPPRLATEVGATHHGPNPSKPLEGLGHSPAESRHRGKANVAFTDGHAEARTLRQLGYQVNNADSDRPDVQPDGPEASNHLWTGKGRDPLR